MKEKKTVLRTIRLSSELNDLLQADAEESNLSVNALLNQIVARYEEWDRHALKYGFVTVARETFRELLAKLDKREVEDFARKIAGMPEEITIFWLKKANLEALLSMLSIFSKYTNLYSYEMEVDGKNYAITLHHDLGENWSITLRYFISQFVESILGSAPKTEIHGNLITVHFSADAAKKTESLKPQI